MYVKENGYSVGVFLTYTITIISLPAVGWCEPLPHPAKPSSHLAPRNVRNRVRVTTNSVGYSSTREGGKEQQLDPRQADEAWFEMPAFYRLQSRDGSQPEPSGGGRSGHRLRATMAPSPSDKRFQTRHKAADEECVEGEIHSVIHGKVSITGQLDLNLPKVGYQSGSAGPVWTLLIQGKQVRGDDALQRLQPVVECGDDAMTLTVRRRRAGQLQLDPGNESSVPLSRLPPQCGYSAQTTVRDLSLMVHYNACHVTQEDDRYVLPLLWRGTPVQVSCPVSQIQPRDAGLSSLCCSSYGLTVKVQGPSAAEELSVNVRGEWTPLVVLAEQCGYILDRRRAEITITAPFVTCGITVKDGRHSLSLQIGEKTFKLSCLVPSHEEIPQKQEPLIDIAKYETREPTEPGFMDPSLWAPPFYLAPLHHPHPTHGHKYPGHYVLDANNPPTPSSNSKLGPQPLPDSQDSPQHPVWQPNKHVGVHSSLLSTAVMGDLTQLYPDLQQQPETPVFSVPESRSATTLSFLAKAPSPQPPSHAFNPYYHYYHHPKIPLPGPAQYPDPDSEILELTKANSGQFPWDALEIPNTLPTNPELVPKAHQPHAPYLPHSYPHSYYYFPYIASGEAKRVAPPHPDAAAETDASHDRSPLYKYNINHADEMMNNDKSSLGWIKHPFFSETLEDTKRLSAPVTPEPDPVTPPSVPVTTFSHRLPLYPYYDYPLYYSLSPTSKKPVDKHRTTTKSQFDVQNLALNPFYYYYHLYQQPEVTSLDQDLHSADVTKSRKAESQLLSDSSRMDVLAHADETEYVSIPQSLYHPFHSFDPYFVPQQHLYDAFSHPDGEEDRLEANAPSTPPRDLGAVSDFGCCWHPVQNCTVEQHLLLVMPHCVLQSVLASDIYIMALDGCGLSKDVFGPTVLDVQGISSDLLDHTSLQQNSPVRLVECGCGSSTDSPGEVRLHGMDQPEPDTIAVQLRISTDQSFTSYHPEAHLPLSLIRGRPLYLEVSLLDPPEPDLALLVHSCTAYTHTPYTSWMPIYDSCLGQSDSQLLPSDSHHIWRIVVSSFLFLPSESPSDMAKGGSSRLEDPEIYFLCLTTVCFAADDCTVSCINSPNSEQ